MNWDRLIGWVLVAVCAAGMFLMLSSCNRYERHTRELFWPGGEGECPVVTVEMPHGAEIEDVRMYEHSGTVYVVAPVPAESVY